MGRVCGNIKGSEAVTTVGIERYPLFTRDSMLCVCVFSDLFARRIAQQDPLLLFSRSLVLQEGKRLIGNRTFNKIVIFASSKGRYNKIFSIVPFLLKDAQRSARNLNSL